MPLRLSNPEKFNKQVLMSWELINYVVSNIDEEVFIAHFEPIQGIEYNCLSLVARNRNGEFEVAFMLNRNGQNSDVLKDIWEKIATSGIKNVGEQLIEICGFSKSASPRDTNITRTCEKVLNWIKSQKDQGLFVGVSNFPGCNRDIEYSEKTDLPTDIWPIPEHGPEIIMGIDGVVMVRLNQIDETIKIENQNRNKP